ncbi:hypothetical protein J6590_033585 [Homalodisca vitripennis]|nr:hypothetical protein J6590_033585 [Homalodisca vitripennis]
MLLMSSRIPNSWQVLSSVAEVLSCFGLARSLQTNVDSRLQISVKPVTVADFGRCTKPEVEIELNSPFT